MQKPNDIIELQSNDGIEYLSYSVETKKRIVKRNDIRKGNALKKAKLKSIVCDLIKVERKDISLEFVNDLVTIAQGKIWSEDFDNRAKKLAKDINDEFDRLSNEMNL